MSRENICFHKKVTTSQFVNCWDWTVAEQAAFGQGPYESKPKIRGAINAGGSPVSLTERLPNDNFGIPGSNISYGYQGKSDLRNNKR